MRHPVATVAAMAMMASLGIGFAAGIAAQMVVSPSLLIAQHLRRLKMRVEVHET
jgi:hypothetical protein